MSHKNEIIQLILKNLARKHKIRFLFCGIEIKSYYILVVSCHISTRYPGSIIKEISFFRVQDMDQNLKYSKQKTC